MTKRSVLQERLGHIVRCRNASSCNVRRSHSPRTVSSRREAIQPNGGRCVETEALKRPEIEVMDAVKPQTRAPTGTMPLPLELATLTRRRSMNTKRAPKFASNSRAECIMAPQRKLCRSALVQSWSRRM